MKSVSASSPGKVNVLRYSILLPSSSGSVRIRLKPEYLQKLTSGRHEITALFDDGKADADFTVVGSGNSGDDSDGGDSNGNSGSSENGSGSGSRAATGDESMALLWAGVLVTSAMLLACLLIIRRRKA